MGRKGKSKGGGSTNAAQAVPKIDDEIKLPEEKDSEIKPAAKEIEAIPIVPAAVANVCATTCVANDEEAGNEETLTSKKKRNRRKKSKLNISTLEFSEV